MRAIVTRLRPDKRREKALVTDWPAPERPTGNAVKTQTIYSGVTNGTERNDLIGGNYASPDKALPTVRGYQNVGRVTEIGPDVQALKVGDLLYLDAPHIEYAVIPEDGLLIRLPEDVDLKHAALFGVSSVAVRTCRNAELSMGDRVLIVGAGVVGQMTAQIAAAMGGRVVICDIDRSRLEIAGQIGAAEEVLDVSGDGWAKKIVDATFDTVIDLAGAPGLEDKLLVAARHGGRVLFIAGRFQINYTFMLGQQREITIKQNGHFDQDDLATLCRLVRKGLVRLDPLVQDTSPVSAAAHVYDTLRDRPSELLGTVFIW